MKFPRCPFCGSFLLAQAEGTWDQIPLYEDGFSFDEGVLVHHDLLSVYCTRCGWVGDGRYYEMGEIGDSPPHFHIMTITDSGFTEHTAVYLPPRRRRPRPLWRLEDLNGTEFGRFPTLVEAVKEAMRSATEAKANVELVEGAGCPPKVILQMALEALEESKEA